MQSIYDQIRAVTRQWLVENRDDLPQITRNRWNGRNKFIHLVERAFCDELADLEAPIENPRDLYWGVVSDLSGRWTGTELRGFASELLALRDALAETVRIREALDDGAQEDEPEPAPELRGPPPNWPNVWDSLSDTFVEGRVGEDGPQIGCVYALYDEYETLLYVGKAQRFQGRLRGHTNDHGKRQAGFSRWRAWPIDDESTRRGVERHLIRSLDPLLNVAGR